MNAVYGLYPDGHAAQEAVDRLCAAGVDEDDITILSSQPMEDFAFGRRGRENWMWWTASLGGLVGGLFGTWLTRATQYAWPLETGGMPIAPWWPNMIIIFELTMLGAIIATVITLLVTAGLPTRGTGLLYDTEVTNGKILVGLERLPGELAPPALTSALRAPRGAVVKTVRQV